MTDTALVLLPTGCNRSRLPRPEMCSPRLRANLSGQLPERRARRALAWPTCFDWSMYSYYVLCRASGERPARWTTWVYGVRQSERVVPLQRTGNKRDPRVPRPGQASLRANARARQSSHVPGGNTCHRASYWSSGGQRGKLGVSSMFALFYSGAACVKTSKFFLAPSLRSPKPLYRRYAPGRELATEQ